MYNGRSGKLGSTSAKEYEKVYDWVGAVVLYEADLNRALKRSDFSEAGEIQERIGVCLHNAARQAESREGFKERIEQAIEAYDAAQRLYEELASDKTVARIHHCKAMARYLDYWLSSDPSEKRKMLDDCLELASRALAGFLEAGDMLAYGRTYSELSPVLFYRVTLEWDTQTAKSITEKGLDWGRKAFAALSQTTNSSEIAWIHYALATCLNYILEFSPFTTGAKEIGKHRSRVVEHLGKALELSERIHDVSLLGWVQLWLGAGAGGEEALRHLRKALECGEQTKDKELIGASLDWLACVTYLKAIVTENPDTRRSLADEAMQLYEKSQENYFVLGFLSPRNGFIGAPAGYSEHYLQLATWETDLTKRLELLELAERAGLEALKLAKNSGIRKVVMTALHVVSKVLENRARVDTDLSEKRRRLEQALEYRHETVQMLNKLARTAFDHWNLGAMQNYLAGIKSELAGIEPDPTVRRTLLEEAATSNEEGLKQCTKMMQYFDKTGFTSYYAALQGYQDAYARLLTQLYDSTNDPDHLTKAIEISKQAIESASKLDIVVPMAQSYWAIAKAQDNLKTPLAAARNFDQASRCYTRAAEKIPQLKDFYQDYAFYMQAWKEIEEAKKHHLERDYGQASRHYEKIADLHESTSRWRHLAPNYRAWARLEEAEDLSRKEQPEGAMELFKQAAELFAEARLSIKARLEDLDVGDEKEMAAELVGVSALRRDYCLGRTRLEEARTLDRQGDHTASSQKYASAAGIFERTADAEPLSRQELQSTIYLCRAWQRMMLAEAKASPTLYGEAAELFEQAKDHAFDEQTSHLALASSSLCKALETGTAFEISRDPTMYSEAKTHLATTANHYLRAGLEKASAWVNATQNLFDSYVHIGNAEAALSPAAKTQSYRLAEKYLDRSAELYEVAHYIGKRDEVLKMLAMVKEKREFTVSVAEVLEAPAIASSTTLVSAPAQEHEVAVGLETFDHTNIQAHVSAPPEVKVGDEFEVRLDLVNVARNSGLLVRVDGIATEGFKVNQLPSQYRFEKGSIDMRGKTLEFLKIETLKITMEAIEAGTFDFCPTVVYVDDVGTFRSCRCRSVLVTIHPPLFFKFQSESAGKVFDSLVQAFVKDYVRQGLVLQQAGWRSLPQISKNAKVSLRSVYGHKRRHGSAISELKSRGLIETRLFLGQRGRGGRVTKVRICYERETIKRYVDRRVMKGG